MTDDATSKSQMNRCLHCAGTGTEPFSDDEDCQICLGEGGIPEEINRQYYEKISEVLDE